MRTGRVQIALHLTAVVVVSATLQAGSLARSQLERLEPAAGAVEALDDRELPRLWVDAAHPFHPRYGNRHLLLVGVSDRAALTIWRNEKGFDWRHYLRVLATNGFNYVRQDVSAWNGISTLHGYPAQFTQCRWPFARTGPGTALDGGPRFDLSRFDGGFFRERLVPFLEEAERLGIIVELTLFDDCRRRRALEDSLYADTNNVNELGLQPGDDPHGDDTLGRPALLSLQEGYVAQVLEATARFGNVIYEVANETGGARWVAHFVALIHRQLPGALVSAGEMSTGYDPVQRRCDLIAKHRGQGGLYRTREDVARHRASLLELRRGGKPVAHNEFFLFANRSTDDPNFVRWMFWADFTGGGHANFFDFTWWRGHGRTLQEGTPSQPPPEVILGAGRGLRRFLEQSQAPFWAMAPHDELAVGIGRDGAAPFVYALPGEFYIVYMLVGGGVALDLSGTTGEFVARWFDPREGYFTDVERVQGGGVVTLGAPSGEDWALVVRKPAP